VPWAAAAALASFLLQLLAVWHPQKALLFQPLELFPFWILPYCLQVLHRQL